MSPEDLLAAMQAQMVYYIMAVADGTQRDSEWNQQMAMAGAVRSHLTDKRTIS